MKVIVADTAGFCMGVRRAVEMALDNSRGRPGAIRTLGPLIHNRQTLEMLQAQGIEELDQRPLPPQAAILVRAHGIPPGTEQKYVRMGHAILDGTCPKVKTVHKVIHKHTSLGFDIVITGDEGHAEVTGLLGYAGDKGRLIHTVSDIASLPDMAKICLVSQTTFDRQTFDEIAEALRARFPQAEIVVKKTICSATDRRQSETRELASQVDTMIVVGGKNSANTLRLAKIARSCGTPTQHVETVKEIDLAELAKFEVVGITGGASTPGWMMKRVADFVQLYARRKQPSLQNRVWGFLDLMVNVNVFAALGSAAVYCSSCILQGIPLAAQTLTVGAAISVLYIFSMYLWNSLASIETTRHLGMSRYEFYSSHRWILFGAAGVGIAVILWLSHQTSPALFYLMLFLTGAGSLYHATLVPSPLLRVFHYRSIKDVPTSRDLFVSLAWAVLLTFIPHTFTREFTPSSSTAAVFAWVFLLAYLRCLIFDLRDIEGDRIMGRETLVTIIGENRVRQAIPVVLATGAILLALIAATSTPPSRAIRVGWVSQLVVLAYFYGFIKRAQKTRIARPALFGIFADMQFYVCGATVIAAHLVFG